MVRHVPEQEKTGGMTKLLTLLLIAGIALAASPSYGGGGIPVIDVANLAKMAKEMAVMQKQLDQMTESYTKQLEQLEQAVQQTQSITGPRNMGNLLNGAEETQMRHYVPDDMDDLIGGGQNIPGASAIPQEFTTLKKEYHPLSPEDFGDDDATLPANAAYMERSDTDYAAIATSEAAYRNAANRMKGYEAMLKELNETQDVKASVDLLARISAENGIIMNEVMRLQALQMRQAASADNHSLTGHRGVYDANQYLPPTQASKEMP